VCAGIGVGPANLSLASLLYRHRELSNRFLEKRPSFGWHDEQQLDGTSLQVSVFKEDYSKPYTGYLNYLRNRPMLAGVSP
jgi:lysine N6-hydroxylase